MALVGQTAAQQLFGDADPVDQVIRVRRVPLTVIGVLERKGQNALGQDQDDIVLMPISTARNRVLGRTQGKQRASARITVKVRDGADMKATKNASRTCCASASRCSPVPRITFFDPQPDGDPAGAGSGQPRADPAAGRGASVSLLVGGIGIMNIMLVSA